MERIVNEILIATLKTSLEEDPSAPLSQQLSLDMGQRVRDSAWDWAAPRHVLNPQRNNTMSMIMHESQLLRKFTVRLPALVIAPKLEQRIMHARL